MRIETDHAEADVREQFARVGAFCRLVFGFWRTPVVVLAVGAVACAVFLFVRKPAYRSETVVLYSEGVRAADDTERPDTTRGVSVRLKEILMSRAALDAVIHEFNLYPDIRRTRGPVDAVDELHKHIEFRAPGGDTFSIAFTGANPKEAQTITARLADLVIARDADLRRERAIVTRDFLETEETRTDADLREKEQDLAAFIGKYPRFAFDATPQATGAAIRASLGGATTARPQAPVVMRPRAGAAGGAPADPLSPTPQAGTRPQNPEEARAKAALAAARANLAELSARFTPAHPDVRAAQAEVDRATERALVAASSAPTLPAPPQPAAPAPVDPTPARPVVVSPVVPRAAGPAAPSVQPAPSAGAPTVVALETEWVKLTRAVTEARQHQNQIEATLFKASVLASSESGGHGVQVTVIDPAFLPEKPVPPGRTIIAGIFAAVSVVLGLLAAVVRAALDDRVHGARDLHDFADILVEVPRETRRAHAAS